MFYKIYPIYLGYNDVESSNAFWRSKDPAAYRLTCGAFVLEDESGEYILVDSGIPTSKEVQEKGLPHRQMVDERYYMEEIQKLGVVPEKVKTILLTHLHWDHAWNLSNFPNASIYVQKREMAHAIAPLPHERGSYSLVPGNGGPDWLKAILQIVPLDGDVEFAPGIRLVTTPGHTPGSMSVLVDTKDGTYGIISDFIIHPRNFTECIPVGSINSHNDWYATHKKLQGYDFISLSVHDEKVYSRKVYG